MNDKNKINLNIGFIGMSHIGQNSSVVAAEKVTKVTWYDKDKKLISNLQKQISEIDEPQLSAMMKKNCDDIVYTSNIKHLIDCDIIYLSKDVPTNDKGKSELKVISNLINNIYINLSEEPFFVILCQVPSGFTRKLENKFKNLYYQV